MQYYEHAYETHAYLPIYFAVTLSMYTLIPTVYQALLKSAVSGTDHRIHTTKKSLITFTSGTQEGRASPADVAGEGMQNSAGKHNLWAKLASLAWLTQAIYECAVCSVSVCFACCLFFRKAKSAMPIGLSFYYCSWWPNAAIAA